MLPKNWAKNISDCFQDNFIIVKPHLPIMSGGVLFVGDLLPDALDLALGGKRTSKTQKPEEWWSPSRNTTSTEQRWTTDPMFLPTSCAVGQRFVSVWKLLEESEGEACRAEPVTPNNVTSSTGNVNFFFSLTSFGFGTCSSYCKTAFTV